MRLRFSIFITSICVVFGVAGGALLAQQSSNFNGKVFFNPWLEDQGLKSFFTVLKWKLFGTGVKDWPTWVENKAKPQLPTELEPKQIAITFVNHASFLIQTRFGNLLTDPIFSERASPLSFAGPKRVRAPGLDINELPTIDVVFISHNHYDHLDLPSLKSLNEKFKPVFVVPLRNRKLLESVGIDRIIELDWWQDTSFGNMRLTLTPVQHWSARTPFDRNECLWGGLWLESDGHKIYFAGDTGYGPHFLETYKRFSAGPDIALLPIGAYEPRWFMKVFHMNPEEAVMAHKDLQAKVSYGTHFGTFQLTDEGIDEPLIHLKEAREKLSLDEKAFTVLEVGETKLHSL